jgi:NADPH-dependent 2,4-dienoyl-CoA reductase/sulfur reductase-like enzyme
MTTVHPDSRIRAAGPAGLVLALTLVATGCTPTVRVATDEPITINLNINIQHEIRVKVERELDDLFSEDSELF